MLFIICQQIKRRDKEGTPHPSPAIAIQPLFRSPRDQKKMIARYRTMSRDKPSWLQKGSVLIMRLSVCVCARGGTNM